MFYTASTFFKKNGGPEGTKIFCVNVIFYFKTNGNLSG